MEVNAQAAVGQAAVSFFCGRITKPTTTHAGHGHGQELDGAECIADCLVSGVLCPAEHELSLHCKRWSDDLLQRSCIESEDQCVERYSFRPTLVNGRNAAEQAAGRPSRGIAQSDKCASNLARLTNLIVDEASAGGPDGEGASGVRATAERRWALEQTLSRNRLQASRIGHALPLSCQISKSLLEIPILRNHRTTFRCHL
jgi:hypothetical protein